MTKLFLAGLKDREQLTKKLKPKYVLESYYYIADWQTKMIHEWDMFLLDSGTFTFIKNSEKANIDFDEYLDGYIEFINKYDVKYFFELDIDLVVGYEKVKEMREKLEKETNKKCIPVWHKNRGIQEFKKLCQEYEYIAIGGFASKHIKPTEYDNIKKLVAYANSKNIKVHGLGFTQKKLEEFGFYSCDSTSWIAGSKYGRISYFNGKEMEAIKKPKNKKTQPYLVTDEFCIKEWIKYQKYLDTKYCS